MKIQLIILLTLMFACKKNDVNNNKIINEPNTIVQDSLKITQNMLLEKSDATKILGKAIKQEKILLDDLYGEFRGNIYYKYSELERQSKSIYIEEVTWEKDDKNYLTIWYEVENKKLIPKAYLIWDKQSEF
ncbi:hypothetical protein Q4566_16535 [Tamlana sp. 2_MG-2023]|uniref:hypothetical protein n=1 Tax=unclassified Tamlana TaxID=2614803 RepID=UPI0026E14C3C|nr:MULTISPECIES: hypothetical protein [unclassified Tamlana]MDO6761816.1 hypothetical protein [Tamlana sp. 2_MG-2023]MDO6792579.1 hypothetical protein [Tamlana sp. 1_MG-2023]